MPLAAEAHYVGYGSESTSIMSAVSSDVGADSCTATSLVQAKQEDLPEWSVIPPLVLIMALEHVDVRQRCRCALVSSSWAAAVAATSRVCFLPGAPSASQFVAFQDWLMNRKTETTSLTISLNRADGPQCLDKLPLRKLQDLELRGYKIDSTSNHDQETGFSVQPFAPKPYAAPGVLADAVTGLTRLVLDNVVLMAAAEQLAALNTLTALKHLELNLHVVTDLEDQIEWSCLQHLTHLSLSDNLAAAALPELSSLRKLEHLKVDVLQCRTGMEETLAGIAQVPQLTSLTIYGSWIPFSTNSSTPWLTRLTALEQLQLHSIAQIEPAVLSSFTGLQCLRLAGTLQPDSAAGTAALLETVASMPHLTELSLPGVLDSPAPTAAAAYAALSSSSSMRKLDLSKADMPVAAWQHIFKADRQLPFLTSLVLGGHAVATNSGAPTSLAALPHWCPALRQLRISCGSSIDQQLLPLQELPCLTSLCLQLGYNASGRAAAAVLKELTQLQELRVFIQGTTLLELLQPLTALSRLQLLAAHMCTDRSRPWHSASQASSSSTDSSAAAGGPMVVAFRNNVRDLGVLGAAVIACLKL